MSRWTKRRVERLMRKVFRDLPEQPRDPRETVIRCIYCQDRFGSPDVSGHLSIHAPRRTFHCFRCDAKGTLFALFRDIGLDDFERSTDVASYANEISDFLESEADQVTVPITLPEGTFRLRPTSEGFLAKRALSYLESRHITASTLKTHWIGVSTTGKTRGCLIFPILDATGKKLVYWTSRRFMFEGRKTVHATIDDGLGTRTFFYNLHKVVGRKKLIVCEGPMDVLRHLKTSAVAALGSNLTFEHVNLIIQHGFQEVILCWDPDATAKAIKTAKRLDSVIPTRIAILRDGDPNDLDKDDLFAALRQARRYSLRLEFDELM